MKLNLDQNFKTHSLTHSRLVNLIDVTLACEDVHSKLAEVVLLLMLVMRIMLATVYYRFRSWGLVIKLNFCSDIEHIGQAGVWS